MIPRHAEARVRRLLTEAPAVALLGPRQVGKTTMARDIADAWTDGAVYLDLERPADRRRLDDADAFLRSRNGGLVVLDEVQLVRDLFPILRGVIDARRRAGQRTGQFLLLGSASLDLINLSSESLAGRVAHVDLAGVAPDEAQDAGISSADLWVRGGFPDSLEAGTDASSLRWRADLIRSYLERDVPMFAPRIPAQTLHRLWTMVAHTSGGLFNATRIAANLGVTPPTVDRYVDLLTDLGLVRRLRPWHVNTGKRMTKAPKIFVRDTGLLHALLEIETLHDLRGHPAVGSSFESFAVEALANASSASAHHVRTATGDEVDLVLVRGGLPHTAVEVKLSTAPTVSAGFHRACDLLDVQERYVVHPETAEPPYQRDGATIIGLTQLVRALRERESK